MLALRQQRAHTNSPSIPLNSVNSINQQSRWSGWRCESISVLTQSNGFIVASVFKRQFSNKAEDGKGLFNKILIANRGEIACRVMKTARKLGIKTVAVYSEPDAHAKHVQMADEAICIGPAASAESYLNMQRILDACKKTGAEAVHPGYGFLSENAAFCDLLEANGVIFIGPKAKAMVSMGLKIESKIIAKKAGVHTIPGFVGEVKTEDDAIRISQEIGYPVMIKASAGGGGKGMRVAYNDKEAREGFRLSIEEARKSFKSDTMFVEKYIEEPRHIEIQVLLDRFGGGVYLNERECSIQRRNQKVLEEAPSTFLDASTRAAMGEQALSLARAVNYESAGTCEFLVDKNRKFYFLEMNTRLQVEHPITEAITGVDIVEHMIRVAAGQKLALKQSDIGINGWALEARVYAEDPFRNFLPSIGRLTRYVEPSLLPGVRCDSGILEGSQITMYYDPLICKLVTHGRDRSDAVNKMKTALDSYVIRGVTHNISFLRAILDTPRFLSGATTTKFIQEEYPNGFKGTALTEAETTRLVAGAVIIHAAHLLRSSSIHNTLHSFASNKLNFFKDALRYLFVTVAGRNFLVQTHVTASGHYQLAIQAATSTTTVPSEGPPNDFYDTVKQNPDKAPFAVDFEVSSEYKLGDLLTRINIQDGKRQSSFVSVLQLIDSSPFHYNVQYHGTVFDLAVVTPRERQLLSMMPMQDKLDTSGLVMSPMPGAMVSVNVKPGDSVLQGQEVCVVEAMKMQNSLKAPRDGVIRTVKVKKGDTVATDQVLMEFE